MRVYELILKKRNGEELSPEEIDYLVQGYAQGVIPDYQMAAWAMAVYFRGMTKRETADLTMAMARSGDMADLTGIKGIKVDKHSTGGVGDKTTLVLGPLVASLGVPVAKMSGRGLGHTGGTIDKLESIPGFSASLSKDQFTGNVNRMSLAVVGQTGNMTPADKKLYALRDVTATVDSIPLIASSIMSKKIAAGADAIVLDVKTGRGAFMSRLEDAKELARTMVDIGTSVGRQTVAFVTDMDQPLGHAVGNALEVKEAIATLQGEGPADLRELCLTLGAEMVVFAGVTDTIANARHQLEQSIATGSAFEKLCEMVLAQGGDDSYLRNSEKLPAAQYRLTVAAKQSGYISGIDALQIGLSAMMLGAGRATKDDVIDPAVGVVLQAKVGEAVDSGSQLAIIHSNDEAVAKQAAERVRDAFRIAEERTSRQLIYDRITG